MYLAYLKIVRLTNIKKPMNAFSVHLEMLYRLIFSQIYARVWDIDPVLLSIDRFSASFFFFWRSLGKKQMMVSLLAVDYPFTIWVKIDFIFCCSTLSNNKLKHLPKEVFSRNSNLLKL